MESSGSSEVERRVAPFAAAMTDPTRDLDERALALSGVFRPGLDVIGYLSELDQLAAECPTPTRHGVFEHLFGSGRFVGDRSDYHHWRNSCLDRVIVERRGMPITLSIVAIEVARRVGVPLVAVGMPGHFLVGDPADPNWFADPFHARSDLDPDDCRALAAAAGVGRWSPRFLDPTPDRLVIARVLNNLRASCQRRGDRVRLALVMRARLTMPEFAAEADDARLALSVLN